MIVIQSKNATHDFLKSMISSDLLILTAIRLKMIWHLLIQTMSDTQALVDLPFLTPPALLISRFLKIIF